MKRVLAVRRILPILAIAASAWGQGPAPAPTITGFSPAQVPAGTRGLFLEIDGTGFFVAGASTAIYPTVTFRGTTFTAIYESSTLLFVSVPASLLEQAGNAAVFVTNPDAQNSNTAQFPVLAPTITSVTPTQRTVGSGSFTLTVNGTNFVNQSLTCDCSDGQTSEIVFDGTPVATTWVSTTQLTALIPGPLAGPPRSININVRNPQVTPATGTLSANFPFAIVGGPSVTSVNPVSRTAGTPGTTSIVLTGTNFLAGDVVYLDGPTTQLATVVNSATQVTASLPANFVTFQSNHTVGIWRVADSYTSNGVPFIVNGTPQISSMTPAARTAANAPLTLAIRGPVEGATYISNEVVEWTPAAGAPVTLATTYINGANLSAVVPGNLLTTPGTATVRVRTIDGVLSNAATFTIYPVPVITSLVPSSTNAGHSAFTLTVNGTDIRAEAILQWNGNPLETVAGEPGVLQASIPAPLVATAGTAAITIRTSDGVVSAPATFTILGAPTITSLSPSSRTAGSAGFTLTVNGTNFGNGSVVRWNGTPLTTTFGSATQLTAPITAGLIATAGTAAVTVAPADGTASAPATFQILNAPTITSLSPPTAVAGGAEFALVVTGAYFANTMTVRWNTTPLATVYNSATQLTATVPAALIASAGSVAITVATADGVSTAPRTFTIYPKLLLVTSAMPGAIAGVGYTFQFTGTGGVPPYTWSITGLPAGLNYSASTGVVSGTAQSSGTANVTVVLTDTSGQTATATFPFEVKRPVVPLDITTPSIPNGTATVPYGTSFAAVGGTPGYSFSISGGTVPPGLTLTPEGSLGGTPTARGQYRFIVRVTDSVGATSDRAYDVTILAPPLLVTGAPTDGTVGSPVSAQFGASGGVPPYTFGVTGSIPSGTSFSGGTLSGTATSPGTFQFTVAVTDSVGTVATRAFTMTIRPAALRLTGTAGDGTINTPYSAQFAAEGGTPPYTFTANGLPPGVALSGSSLGGTPTADGVFNISVTAKDSAGATATGSFTVTIAPVALVITTASLPGGTVGASYSATLAATGGVPPFSWSFGGLPQGLTGSSGGGLSGSASLAGSFNVAATVTDSKGTTTTKSFTVTITGPALVITTATLPGATVGAVYGAVVAATGGVPPYTWSASGLPTGITFAAGSFAGSPTQPGTANISVTVTDSAGTTATRSYTVPIALPSAPALNIGGPGTSNPGTQQQLQIGIGTPYPGPINVTLTLTFTPDSGADDPAVQFQTGGRTTQVTIPAGSTTTPNVPIQTGTVAGTVTITARLTAFSSDVTPTPVPTRTIRISPGPPVISSVTAVRNAGGFVVTVTGFASSREIAQALFTFTAAAGANLQTTQVSAPVDTIFSQWWSSSASAPFGSQFTLAWTFTVQGDTQSIAAVGVTLTNRLGNSNIVTANLQ